MSGGIALIDSLGSQTESGMKNMTVAILEAVFGTLAAGLVIWACWNEKRLITWEDKHLIPWAKQFQKRFQRSCRQWISK